MSIKLKGSSDGSVSFDAPADTSPSGSDITLVLPTTVGSAEQFLKNSGTAGTLEFSSMVETSTGVGIGTSSPSHKLNIDSTSDADLFRIRSTAIANNTNLRFGISGSVGEIHASGGSSGTLAFKTYGSERMRIDTLGNVGIGTSSATQRLTVGAGSGPEAILVRTGSGNTGELRFSDTGDDNYQGALVYNHVSNSMQFSTNGTTERMRIDSSGDVEISQTKYLTWVHSFGGTHRGRISCFANDSMVFENGSGNSERMRIDSSGRLLVGTSSSRGGFFGGASGFDTAFQIEKAGYATASIVRNSNNTAAPSFILGKTRGTSNGATTIVSSGDVVGEISFQAADGAKLVPAASIEAEVDTTPGTNDMPGRLVFSTTNDGAASPTERMRIDNNGRVGIGTASAAQVLQVHKAGSNPSYVHVTNGTSNAASSDGMLVGLSTSAEAIVWNQENTVMRFATHNTERMRIDSSGRLGLGTTSPGSFNSAADDLVISNSGNCGITIDATSSTSSSIYFADGSTGSEAYRGYISYAHAADRFEFATAGTEQMRIDNNGSFYLNTTADDRYAQTSGDGNFVFKTDDGSSGGSLIVSNDADNGWSAVYINKFDWSSGDDGRYINFFKNGAGLCSILLNSSGNVVYQTGSDYRLKENIVPMTNGITRLKQLLPKQFNMIDDPDDNLCDGFLAHEVQTVVPEAVSGTHNGTKTNEEGNQVPDYQGLDYGKLTPLLTAALQEAIAKIETLETKVAALEAQ